MIKNMVHCRDLSLSGLSTVSTTSIAKRMSAASRFFTFQDEIGKCQNINHNASSGQTKCCGQTNLVKTKDIK